MPKASIIDSLLIDSVRAAGTAGTPLDKINQPIIDATGGTRTVRAIAQRATHLVRTGQLARRYVYFTPEGMKSPVRHYVYFTPENVRYGDGDVEQGPVASLPVSGFHYGW